jgi:hypothetical protein
MKPRSGSNRRQLSTSPFKVAVPPPVETFEVNDRVSHDTYGLGRVTSVESERAVTVTFGGQTIRIGSPYVKLTKL